MFNGSSSRINVPALTPSDLSSVSFWFNSLDTTSTIFSMGKTGVYNWLNIRLNDGKLEAGYGSNNGAYLSGSSVKTVLSYNDGSWYHVVCTFTGTYGTNQLPNIYVNASDVSTVAGAESGSLHTASGEGAFGYYNAQNILYFNGQLDQVRIFNKVLSTTEIQTLADETACDALACGGTTNTLDILSDGSCIAAYPLDGSPADLSGNYNGVQTDVTYPVGEFDLAGSFNGVNSKISNPNITPLSSASVMSVSIWFKRNDIVFERGIMSIGVDGAAGGGIFLLAYGYSSIGSRNLFFEFGSAKGRYIFTNTTNTNQWYHIVITSDGSTVNAYLNGSLQGSSSQGGGLIAPDAILSIGSMNVSGGKYHNGEIDQIRIFNKALSAGEVTTLYNETACN